MNIDTFLIICLFAYWLGEAATEAFTNMSQIKRVENPVIKSGWGKADGWLDYHTWRTIEYLGIIITILILLPTYKKVWYVGWTLVAWFFYQRLFGYARKGELFPYKSPYRIGRFRIPHNRYILDPLTLAVGSALIYYSDSITYFIIRIWSKLF